MVVAQRGTGADAGSIVAASAGPGPESALRMHAALLRIPVQDLVDIRVLLESYAAGRAAEGIDPEALAPLRDLVELMNEATSPAAFHRLDTSFHVTLGSLSGNVLLPVLMAALRGSMEREMLSEYARMEDWEPVRLQLIAEHREIIEKDRIGRRQARRRDAGEPRAALL